MLVLVLFARVLTGDLSSCHVGVWALKTLGELEKSIKGLIYWESCEIVSGLR